MKNTLNKILLLPTLLLLQTSGFANKTVNIKEGLEVPGSVAIVPGAGSSVVVNVNGLGDVAPTDATQYTNVSNADEWAEYYQGEDPVGLINKGTVNFKLEDLGNNLAAGELKIQDAGIVVNANNIVFENGSQLTAVMNSASDTIKYPTLYNGASGVIDVQAGAIINGGQKPDPNNPGNFMDDPKVFIFDNAGTVKFAGESTVKNINIQNSGVVDISDIDENNLANTVSQDVFIKGGKIKFAPTLLKNTEDAYKSLCPATGSPDPLANLQYDLENVTLTADPSEGATVISVAPVQASGKYELTDAEYYSYMSIYRVFSDRQHDAGTEVQKKQREIKGLGVVEYNPIQGKTSQNLDLTLDRNKEIAYLFYNLKLEHGIELDETKFTNPILFSNEFVAWNDLTGIVNLFSNSSEVINFSKLDEKFALTGADATWMPALPVDDSVNAKYIDAKLIAAADKVVSIASSNNTNEGVTINGDVSEFFGTIKIPANVSEVNLKSGPVMLDMANNNSNPVSLNIGDSNNAEGFGELKVKDTLLINDLVVNQPVTLQAAAEGGTITVQGDFTANKKVKVAAKTKLVI